MPDFFVELSGSPVLTNVPWEDTPSVSRPSRITKQNDRAYRRINATVGTTLQLSAIVIGRFMPEADSVVGLFTMWPLEVPSGGDMPLQTIPYTNVSSIQTFTMNRVGHYTFAIRHENVGGAPFSTAGGVIVIHLESIALP